MFDLLSLIQKLIGGVDAAAINARATEWLSVNSTNYPDTKSLSDGLASFLTAELLAADPELSAEKLRDTIYGVASDIIRGKAGVDPNAHHGMA